MQEQQAQQMKPGEQQFELFEDRIFEQASFNIYRGFLRMRIVECSGTSNGDPWWFPELSLELHSHGAESILKLPLQNHQMIEWLIQALQKTLGKVRSDLTFNRGVLRNFSRLNETGVSD